jgi:hypothetical protein
MYQLVAAALGVAAGAFAWSGDPLVGFLFAVCTVVWVAITLVRRPFPKVQATRYAAPKVD